MSGKLPEVWEAFPLWSEEEIYEKKAERLKLWLMKKVKGKEVKD